MKTTRAGLLGSLSWVVLLAVALLLLSTARSFDRRQDPSQLHSHVPRLARPHIVNSGHASASELADSTSSLVTSDSSSSSSRGKEQQGSQGNSKAGGPQMSKNLSPFLLPMPAKKDCPAWIEEYAKFHRANRGKPGAKYLVYTACPGKSGVGDRIRGMMYLTRQAAAFERVVLFTWRNEPHELHQYLPPAGPIDWMLNGIDDYNYPNLTAVCDRNVTFDPAAFAGGVLEDGSPASSSSSSKASFHSLAFRMTDYKGADKIARRFIATGGLGRLEEYKFVTIHTNEWSARACHGCPAMASPAPLPIRDNKGRQDVSAACLFRILFALSQDVQAAAHAELVRLFGSQASQPGFQYMSMHMRLGGMTKEKNISSSKGGRNGPLVDLLQGIMCMQTKGQEVNVDTREAPVILFTDHPQLRKFVKAARLTDVITTNMEPTHLARMDADEAADANAAISTYVDLALLARSRCAIYSRSGLSMAAWMMGGGIDCYEHLEKGLESCSASLGTL